LLCAGVTVLAMLEFCAVVRPRVDLANEKRARPLGNAILKAIPPGADIWVMEESYRPFWYYLEPRARYFARAEELPPEAGYFLVPADRTDRFIQDARWK